MSTKTVAVKMRTARAGEHFLNKVGDIVEVDRDEARRLIASGQAEPVAQQPEAAIRGAQRRAVKPEPV